MACRDKNGSNCGCGCGSKESALTTNYQCGQPESCIGEPCEEVFCEDCIMNCNSQMSVVLPNGVPFVVYGGERLYVTIQRLMMVVAGLNPEGPTNVRVVGFDDTSITIKWDANTDAEGNMLEYTVSIDGVDEVVGRTVMHTFINLEPDTPHVIKVSYFKDGGAVRRDSVEVSARTEGL